MPLLSISSPDTIQKCADLPLRDKDIFICSYPKSGTTWLQHIVLSLLRADSNNTIPPYQHVSDYAPFFEIDPHWDSGGNLAQWIQTNHHQLGRRVFNTHLRYDMLPSTPITTMDDNEATGRSKFIYVVRSPLDVCVSFFSHLSHQVEGGFEGSFEEFFRDWVDGKVAFGSWADHILSYVPAFADRENDEMRQFLFLSYETMLSDLPKIVAQLVEFLDLTVKDEEQEKLLPTFSFAHMKSESERFQPKSVTWKNQFSFLRKGKSGDANSIVTEQQREIFMQQLQALDFEKTVVDCLGGSGRSRQICCDILQLLVK